MGAVFGGSSKQGSHAVSFLLGAALPTALLFFLASDRLGGGFPTISSSWRGDGSISTARQAAGAANKPATHALAAGSDGRGAAPTQDHEVRRRKLSSDPILSYPILSRSGCARPMLSFFLLLFLGSDPSLWARIASQRDQRCVLELRVLLCIFLMLIWYNNPHSNSSCNCIR